jgi:predicted kinase
MDLETHTVYIMVGIPGSGKSTWIETHATEDWHLISPDQVLQNRYDYVWTPERAAESWAESFQYFGRQLLVGGTIVWDATFITPIIRSSVLHIAKGAGFYVEAIFCDTPLETCLERNNLRNREPVPEKTIQRMADSLVPPTMEEGFDRVRHIP